MRQSIAQQDYPAFQQPALTQPAHALAPAPAPDYSRHSNLRVRLQLLPDVLFCFHSQRYPLSDSDR